MNSAASSTALNSQNMPAIGFIKEFDIAQPAAWDNYAEQLKYFLEANGIEEAAKKRATLLAVCGPQTLSIVRSLVAPNSPSDRTYEELIAVLKNHFSPRPSEIYRRFQFQKRFQNANEDISSYVIALRRLADECNFGATLSERLRDQLVVGLRDEGAQRRLLAETTLTFDDAVSKSLAAEIAERQAKVIHTPQMCADSSPGTFQVRKQVFNKGSNAKSSTSSTDCYGCGGMHSRELCKFKNAICRMCGKKGHIQRVCRSKTASSASKKTFEHYNAPKQKPTGTAKVRSTEFSDDFNSLNSTVSSVSKRLKQSTNVILDGKNCQMEIDSGSDFSIVSNVTFKKLYKVNPPEIQPIPFRLSDYQSKQIRMVGMCYVNAQYGKFQEKLRLLIAHGNHASILGFEWFEPLGIQLVGVHHVGENPVEKVLEEFKDVFQEGLGAYRGPPISLPIDPKVPPIRHKARTVPIALKGKIDLEIDKLLRENVIEPIQNPKWCTPVVPVIKKSGEVRLCGDYKITLNTAMKSHPYPIPSVQHLLANLSGGGYFAKIDLAQAYLQLKVDTDSAEAQTIVTHRGAFKVNRLQFGVNVAPGLFQNMIEDILVGLQGVVPYFDDILIQGSTLEELSNRLREVLKRFSDLGLRAQKDKCFFGTTSIDFLGYTIDCSGIHPSESKVEAIHAAPSPKNKQELQSFLGLLNFYSCFLKEKTDIAKPLYDLLKKDIVFKWTEKHEKAFKAVKELLSSESVLVPFNEKLPIILTCDSSSYGVGAVLSHKLKDGREAPVCYASRTLSTTECNYAQIDKEALALIYGVKKFHHFLYGQNFTLVTDHRPLLGIFTPCKPTPQILSPRMLRWSLLLNAYQYELIHRSGNTIQNADALSRLPMPVDDMEATSPLEVLFIEELNNAPLSANDIAKMSSKDPVVSCVLEWVWKGWPQSCPPGEEYQAYFKKRLELTVHKKCLLWGNRVVIPTNCRDKILKELHVAHPGIERMKALARSYVWWPNIDSDITDTVNTCDECQMSRHAPPKAPVHHWEPTKVPWSRLHVDYAGPFHGQHFLLAVDSYSKWLEVKHMHTTTSDATANALRELFATHGIPDTVVSDNGSVFTSEQFTDFLKSNAIRQVLVAPYHPSSNGQIERMVQSTKDSLKRMLSTGTWKKRIECYLLRQHVTPTSTGFSPAELLMRRKLRTLLDRVHPDFSFDQKNSIDDADAKTRHFFPNDTIYIKNFSQGKPWIPATVEIPTGPCSYKVQTPDGKSFRRHIDQMRRRVPDPPQISDTTERRLIFLPSESSSKEHTPSEDLSSAETVTPEMEVQTSPRRPHRSTKPPEKFKDYVTF